MRACAISCQTARATPENVVRGGTSSRGSPCISHASTSAPGTVSCTGATPKPSAAPPAATIRATYASKYPVPAPSGMCTPADSSSSPPSRYGYGSAISEVCTQWMTAPGSSGPAMRRSPRSARASSASSDTGGVGGTVGSGMVDVSSILRGAYG